MDMQMTCHTGCGAQGDEYYGYGTTFVACQRHRPHGFCIDCHAVSDRLDEEGRCPLCALSPSIMFGGD